MEHSHPRHPCVEVEAAIIRLFDELCTWERTTGRQSIVIIREEGGYCARAQSGKPNIPIGIEDEILLQSFYEKA